MTFLPVVTREMSVLARRRSTYAARAAMAIFGLLLLGWVVASASTAVSAADQGKTVFLVLSSLSFGYALFAGAHTTSDSLSEEKREGTLGLLFLTDLKGYDIVLGKMAATSLSSVFALMSIVPIISLAMFLGGVSLWQVAQVCLVLAVTMFFSLSLGVLVSSISTNERKAMFACTVLLLIATAGPYVLGIAISDFAAPPLELTFVSPLYPFLCIYINRASGLDPAYFWPSLLLQVILSAAFLAASARILPLYVNDLPAKRFRGFRDWLDRMAFGDAARRKEHRAELLDRNAFLWLAARERSKPRYAWLIVAIFAALYAWVSLQFPDMFFELPVALSILFLIHFSFKLWAASEVCSRLIQDRRSGALELLLCTPLQVREIARGQGLALRRIFLFPVSLLILAELALFFGTLRSLPRSTTSMDVTVCYAAAMTTLLLDLWALKWTGLWLSLRGKSIERVLIGTTAKIMALPWALFFITAGLLVSARAITGRPLGAAEVVSTWWLLSIACALFFAIPARLKFLRFFREAATQRFDAPVAELSPEVKKIAPKAHLPARRAIRRRIAWAVALLILVTAPSIRRAYWQRKVETEIQRIQSEGFPVGMQEIGNYYQPLPSTENALALLKQAGMVNLGAFGRRINWGGSFGLEGLAPLSGNTRTNFATTVALNETQIEALRQAVSLRKGYLTPVIDSVWAYPQDLSAYAAVVWMQGVLAVENGKPEEAVEATLLLLKYAAILRQQPVSQAQTACGLALERAQQVIERLIHCAALSPETAAALQNQAQQTDANVLERSIAVRRALVLSRLRDRIGDPGMPPSPVLATIGTVLATIGNRDRGIHQLLLAYREGLQVAQSPPPSRIVEAERLDRAAVQRLTDVPEYLLPAYRLAGVFSFDALLSTRLALMQAMLKIEQFRLANGHLPASIEELGGLPLDPFSGEPLKLLRRDRELKLYSFGLNRIDDTANGAPRHHAGDITVSIWERE